jgi:hypothetical protein
MKWSMKTLRSVMSFLAAGAVLAGLPASAAALPKLPTQLIGRQALQIGPAVVDWTGDSTAFLGGFTGRRAVHRPSRASLRWAGRLRWTSWTSSQALGTGAVWLDDGIPDNGQGTFYPFPAKARAFRPQHGIFTRLALTYRVQGTTYTPVLKAAWYPPSVFGHGYWAWSGL